ncbi:HAD-IB family hydrolase [Sulfurirhabdus autotrophica]|uniref:HAD superfamily hydrolase (TIGR01490 family) n=1 Tax=Sulfurirhabdus autotrophica TaxID=1706046 RepID=A0A4R3YDK9_9PROT|nr:HAD-IB family hydrolase [Sulfurirhabdus autotrophica]TCV90100.1 HAD superfamily hydrolase (TIGR01490 family) [Sulfurirhabdus autotrophica]
MSGWQADKQVVAAFDFDGTMTNRDTLFPFLSHVSGQLTFFRNFILLLPVLVGYKLGLIRNDLAKEQVFTRFFWGVKMDALKYKAAQFAAQKLPNLLRPEAMKRFEWHKKQGHRCILISASLDIYLQPWALIHGFDEVICSSLEVRSDGYISGKLSGANCFGIEKARRLEALMGDRKRYILYAYGDSEGDKELLSMADHAFYREMPSH